MNVSKRTIPTPGTPGASGRRCRAAHFRGRGRFREGLTLIELTVAVGITAIMLLLINQVFNSSTRAMNMGVGRSDIIGNERGAGEQIKLDAADMVGPHDDTDAGTDAADEEGGFLVIAQYQVPSARVIRGPRRLEEIRNAGHPDGPVRSDQLMLFMKRSDSDTSLLPITPKNAATYSNDLRDISGNEYDAQFIKVWYGHARKTAPDGTDGATPAANDLGVVDGYNAFAHEWVLARQATFLVDEDVWPIIGHIHADDARYAGTVSVYPDKPAVVADANYAALTDVAGQVLGAVNTATGSPATDSVIRYVTSGSAGAPDTTYFPRAYEFLYLAERLRVNPNPGFDRTDDLYAYASWQVAQMHPVLFAGVSDFIVEFAADIETTGSPGVVNPDGEIDRADYSIDHDNDEPTTTPPDTTPKINIVNAIKWYGYWYNDPTNTGPGPLANGRKRNPANPTNPNADLPFNPLEPVVFEPPMGYTPYDDTPVPNANATFVFRHDRFNPDVPSTDPEFCDWPYLIRIRYRAHDPRGLIESGRGQHGVWSEHVIQVNRPPAGP